MINAASPSPPQKIKCIFGAALHHSQYHYSMYNCIPGFQHNSFNLKFDLYLFWKRFFFFSHSQSQTVTTFLTFNVSFKHDLSMPLVSNYTAPNHLRVSPILLMFHFQFSLLIQQSTQCRSKISSFFFGGGAEGANLYN